MNSNFGSNQIDSLIMISNARGSHLFAKYGREESPVFKIKAVQNEFGKPKLRLAVMEVVYPQDLYRELDERAAVLKAINDKMVVVKETETTILFVPEMGQRVSTVELPEVDCICCKLGVKSPVFVKGDCSQPITGCVDVEGTCPARNFFFVCQKPRHGVLELDQNTGQWVYQSRCECYEKDTFEIVVWNVSGVWVTQRTIIDCEPQPEVIDVNVINPTLTIVAEYPIDVNVATIPPVVVRTEGESLAVDVVGVANVTIDGPVEVTGLDINFPETITVTTAEDLALAVSVTGVPTVTINGPLEVNGIEISNLDVKFPEVMTITTEGEAPLAVSVTGVSSVTLDGAVEVTGLDVKFPEVMTVTTAEGAPLSVSVAGVPSVTINGPIKLTPYGIYTASAELGDIPGGAEAQALFDTSKSIDQTIFVKIRPTGVTASIQPIVVPAGDTETYALGDPIQQNSNFAFINTTPASKVGVKVTNLDTSASASTLSNPVITIESHEPIEKG